MRVVVSMGRKVCEIKPSDLGGGGEVGAVYRLKRKGGAED